MKALSFTMLFLFALTGVTSAQFNIHRSTSTNPVSTPSGIRVKADDISGTYHRRQGVILMGSLENYTSSTFDDVVVDGSCLGRGSVITGAGFQEIGTLTPGATRTFRIATKSFKLDCYWRIKVSGQKRPRK